MELLANEYLKLKYNMLGNLGTGVGCPTAGHTMNYFPTCVTEPDTGMSAILSTMPGAPNVAGVNSV